MHQPVIRNHFNQHFIIIPPRLYDSRLGIEPVTFWGQENTLTFVSNLQVPPDFWQSRLGQEGIHAGPAETDILAAASQALLERKWLVCPVVPPHHGQVNAKERSLVQEKVIYQIHHPSITLLEPQKLKIFTNKEEARDFLQQFDLDSETLSQLILEANPMNNPTEWDRDKQLDKLAALVVENKMVITQRKVPDAPLGETAAAVTGGIENRTAGLGSEVDGLHNQEWDKVEADISEFKTVKQVDMENLTDDEEAAKEVLLEQGRSEEQIAQVLSSGNDFKLEEFKVEKDMPNPKLYGFDSKNSKYGAKKQDSMYWVNEETYQNMKGTYYNNGIWNKEGVKNHLALPCTNRADVIDVIEVTESHTAVKSTVGKATEQIAYTRSDYTTGMLGKIMPGGGTQITPHPGKTSPVVTRLKGTP